MSSPAYKALLDEAWDLHVRKNAGYAGAENPDPWANFRMCEAFGVSAFEGCMVRLSDKYIRITNLMKSAANDKVGESIRDTLQDLAAYALIAICLLDERKEAEQTEVTDVRQSVPISTFPIVHSEDCDRTDDAYGNDCSACDLIEKWNEEIHVTAFVPPSRDTCPSTCCAASGDVPHNGPCVWCERHDSLGSREDHGQGPYFSCAKGSIADLKS